MANVIDDATIDYVGILAKLELSDEEKEQAKKDMASMLDYIDQCVKMLLLTVMKAKKHFSTHRKEKTRHLLYQKLLNRKERPWDCWI